MLWRDGLFVKVITWLLLKMCMNGIREFRVFPLRFCGLHGAAAFWLSLKTSGLNQNKRRFT